MKVAVLGTSGYTGQLLIRMLLDHREVREIIPVSSSHAGEMLSEVDRGMGKRYMNGEKFGLTAGKLVSLEKAVEYSPDVVIAALPHLKSAELCQPFFGKSVVIDLSADFRIKDPAVFEAAYGKRPPREDLLKEAVYGLCEWNRDEIKKADIIANPGCYPTATLLPLLPLLKEGIIGGRIVTNAISGISGGGRKANINLLFVERSENAGAYAPGTSHRHLPEIAEELKKVSDDVRVLFTPHLAPLRRGIVATTWATLSREIVRRESREREKKGRATSGNPVDDERIADVYEKYYGRCPFINIRGNETPQTKDVLGSNRCDIGWKREGDSMLLFSAIDNLVKGASGQAVQNMNIRFGFNEDEGLRYYGEV